MATILLDHPQAKRHAGWVRKTSVASGKTTTRRVWVSVPDAVSIPAATTLKGQPDWYAEVPDIIKGVAKGTLKVIAEKQPTPAKPKASKSKPKKASKTAKKAQE